MQPGVSLVHWVLGQALRSVGITELSIEAACVAVKRIMHNTHKPSDGSTKNTDAATHPRSNCAKCAKIGVHRLGSGPGSNRALSALEIML